MQLSSRIHTIVSSLIQQSMHWQFCIDDTHLARVLQVVALSCCAHVWSQHPLDIGIGLLDGTLTDLVG